MLPALCLLTAIGAGHLWRLLGRAGRWRTWLRALWLTLLVLSFGLFLKSFFRDYPREHDAAWNSGWAEAFQIAQREVGQGHFRRVVVPPEVREGYVYALYATGYDPRAYLGAGGSRLDPQRPLYPEAGPMAFPPYEVRTVDWASEPRAPDTLYVLGSWNKLPAGARVLAVTHGASGRDVLQVVYFP